MNWFLTIGWIELRLPIRLNETDLHLSFAKVHLFWCIFWDSKVTIENTKASSDSENGHKNNQVNKWFDSLNFSWKIKFKPMLVFIFNFRNHNFVRLFLISKSPGIYLIFICKLINVMPWKLYWQILDFTFNWAFTNHFITSN